MKRPSARRLLGGFVFALLATAGFARSTTGPAITVLKIGYDGGNSNDFAYYGQASGIAAYSMGTTSCNPGTAQVQWTSNDHPVIAQNIFRLKDGRFEQLGQSWLKHGFCAVNESGCGSCQSTPCSTLGIGCADTYWATLNDGQGGGPKYQVNATTGLHADPYPAPTGPSTIRGRLQVLASEFDPTLNAGAKYFGECQYVSAHAASNGNGSIANSWRKLNVVSISNVDGGGTTNVNQPAPYAWKSEDASVTVLDVYNVGEGSGPGSRYCVAYKVLDLGGGTWRYDYVVENVNSDRSAYSFAVPSGGANLTNLFFRDVDYHSGEPFSNTNWTTDTPSGFLRWKSTQTYATNNNANALRWGTMYSFGFVANAPPVSVQAEIEMFKPSGGGSNTLQVMVQGPGGCAPPGIASGPQSQAACAGAMVSFSVTASGAGPFTYQWLHDGNPITGATSSSYSIGSATTGDAGNYVVEVTNGCGTTPSAAATLSVASGSPSITTSPASQTVCAGSPVSFSVGATGSGLSYQWFHGASSIPGATTSMYSIPSAGPGDAGTYRCDVSNGCGTVSSGNATLDVLSGPPTVTSDPQGSVVCTGSPVFLSVGATGSGTLTYQWFHFLNLIPGATSSSYTIPSASPSDAGSYTCEVSNLCGTDTSATANVVVNDAQPTVDTSPQSVTLCEGGDALFFVDATGPQPLEYQWYHDANLLPGENDTSLLVSGATPADAGDYFVEVTNACGTVASAAATLDVLPPGCVISSALYQVSGTSDGSDWCLRITHCGATAQASFAGLPPGSSAAAVASALASAVESLSPIGSCNVMAAVDPPGSSNVRITWASGSLILEVGDGSCASFCTVTTMTSCAIGTTISQIEESTLEPGEALCFCDGGHNTPPCSNPGAIGAGCANSTGSGGALTATGSDSVSVHDLSLAASHVIPNQPGLFFQGNSAIANGEGVLFGNGHRCCGSTVWRLQIVTPNAGGNASTTVNIVPAGHVLPGDARCYQFWYRDPASSCVTGFNLTNGYVVRWSP